MADEKTRVDHDKPPFSRVFVVCSRSHTEEDLRDAFGMYGEVEDVWVVKHRDTKENKGIAYVKFARASEAALAMERLHGTTIGDNNKPIKALLADTKSSREKVDPISQLALNDDRHRSRIFILVSKTMTESEITEEFSAYGKVDHVQILRHKDSNESKGCAYVRYSKPSEAFAALEQCDRQFKAVIAEPRVPKNMMTTTSNADGQPQGAYSQVLCPIPAGYTDVTEPGATNKLTITCHISLNEGQMTRLFDICPGLTGFQMTVSPRTGESKGIAYATFSSPACASYARQKLNNLEYPPGYRLSVGYCRQAYGGPEQYQSYPAANMYAAPDTGAAMPGYGVDYGSTYGGMQQQVATGCPYTDVALPSQQPYSLSKICKARLFFVCAPSKISQEILTDVFCRFSDLIDIQIVPGTAYGYIRYGIKESADAAKMLLDGANVAGSVIRLSFADDDSGNKRAKMDHLM